MSDATPPSGDDDQIVPSDETLESGEVDLGWIAYWRHNGAGMIESHDRMTAIDPTMAAAEASVGYFARESHDLDGAELHYQTCSDKWPGDVACVVGLGRTKGEQGACGDYYALLRRAVILTPDDWFVRMRFFEAMLATGRPEVEARAEVQIETELFASPSKHLPVHADLERALWFGSFAGADRALERSQTIMRETTGWSGMTFVSARFAVVEDGGDDAAVVALARRYVGHRATRPPALADGLVLSALVRHEVMPRAEIAKLRDVWRAEAEASADWQPWEAALFFDSALATTPRDADAALAHIDPASLPAGLGATEGVILGRLFLLAGRPVEAREAFQKAAGVCSFMDSGGAETQSASLVRASYELGRTCEELGDTGAACAAYQRVLDRWGHATPRSLTAESARAARSRLQSADAGTGE